MEDVDWAAVLDRLLLMGTDGWQRRSERWPAAATAATATVPELRGMRSPEAVLSLRSPGTPSRRARLPMIPLDVLTHFT